ncbi:hypothetical protein R5R35_014070 [Gryllus longicercus]|uniref:Uncharacterized protein n=1 Tax=Gryllus longicercus TaxID=2509291 RepID=A0AAN9W0S1_9ORTH
MVRALLVRRARLESGDARALGALTPAERRALDIEDERSRLRARYIQVPLAPSGAGQGAGAGPDGTSLISVLCAPHRRFALVCRHWADTLEW